jgi:hypothetical protein
MTLRVLLSIAAIYMALVGFGLNFAPQAFGSGAVPADASATLIATRNYYNALLRKGFTKDEALSSDSVQAGRSPQLMSGPLAPLTLC